MLVLSPFASASASHYEHKLVNIADQIQRGTFSEALSSARGLIRSQPGGRLGKLLYADLLAARAGPLHNVGSMAIDTDTRNLIDLQQELLVRWNRHQSDPPAFSNMIPSSLLQVSNSSQHVIFADLDQSRLYIYKNDRGNLTLIDDFYVTQGLNGPGKQREGDQRTPVGVYHITGYISGESLPSRYGPGALPINYPNSVDRRYQRTGYGIWIHGTEPFLVNRAPKASDGCLSLNNNDFLHLNQIVGRYRSATVIIDDSPRWVSKDFLKTRREKMLLAVERWRSDWASSDSERYLGNYDSDRFTSPDANYSAWASRKRMLLSQQSELDVSIRDIGLFQYPGERDLILVDFEQRYRSAGLTSTIRKQQHWAPSRDGRWRIVFEGPRRKRMPPKTIVEKPSSDSQSPSSS